jgi:hypothetical protein
MASIFRVEDQAKQATRINQAENKACCLLHDGFLLGLIFDTEDGGNMLFRNVG